MAAVTAHLINTRLKAFEVRDKIAQILEEEIANQKVLAAGIDPLLWDCRVFTQRRLPWSAWADHPDNHTLDGRAIVHIDIMSLMSSENSARPRAELQQELKADFMLSCYAYGKAQETEAGHDPQDVVAWQIAERTVGLVYQILRNPKLAVLGLQGIVKQRHVTGFTFNNPQIEHPERAVHIECIQLLLTVDFVETTQENGGVPLEIISVEHRKDTVEGQLLLSQTIDTTES